MTFSAIEIDGEGDVQLHVGARQSEEASVFIACSRALSRASPFFHQIFHNELDEAPGPPSKESNGVIHLPLDNPAAMSTLLHMMHSRFDQVPAVLSVDQLYDLTVVAHKYDTTASLSPWAAKWTQSSILDTTNANEQMIKILWIYWVLGCREPFFSTARRFIMEAEAPASLDVNGLQTPPDFIQKINSIRLRAVQSLLGIFRDMIRHLLVVDEMPRWCRHSSWLGPHRCESMILGSLTFCLARARLWPLPDAGGVDGSVLDLYMKLKTVVIHDIGQTPGDVARNHADCNPTKELSEAVEDVMNGIPHLETDAYLDHFHNLAKAWQK